MSSLKPYKGTSRKLVVALDVGTTFSGASYVILDPGDIPTVRSVSRFPGQAAGDAKIPSVILYNSAGEVKAVGAEVEDYYAPDEDEEAEQGLVKIERFKMHLRPQSLVDGTKSDMKLRLLPEGKSIVDVLADFLLYMFTKTTAYILEAHANGESLWRSVENDYEVILSHPNGWGGSQQAQMRAAAVCAGLIPDAPTAHNRLHFVTEGEASMNYCVGIGMTENGVKAGDAVLVVDAGGGTIDLSTYCFTKMSPLVLEETAPAACLLQGSTTINDRAEKLLRSKLADSKYNRDEDFETMMKAFEWSTKRSFKNRNDKSTIRFGTIRDNDKKHGISCGQMALSGIEVATMFDPSVDAIVAAAKSQCEASTEKISLAFLVGGFAASPYLFAQLKAKLAENNISLSRPESSTNKAVADGALWQYLGGYVTARVARYTYGTTGTIEFDVDDPEHIARKERVFLSPTGDLCISGAFAPLLLKGTRMVESKEACTSFCNVASPRATVFLPRTISVDILRYHGVEVCPKWPDKEPQAYKTMCTIKADISNVDVAIGPGPAGLVLVRAFDVVLTCGATEMKAHIRWEEKGVQKRSNAEIVFLDDTLEAD